MFLVVFIKSTLDVSFRLFLQTRAVVVDSVDLFLVAANAVYPAHGIVNSQRTVSHCFTCFESDRGLGPYALNVEN
jgi:hypothetical protein